MRFQQWSFAYLALPCSVKWGMNSVWMHMYFYFSIYFVAYFTNELLCPFMETILCYPFAYTLRLHCTLYILFEPKLKFDENVTNRFILLITIGAHSASLEWHSIRNGYHLWLRFMESASGISFSNIRGHSGFGWDRGEQVIAPRSLLDEPILNNFLVLLVQESRR